MAENTDEARRNLDGAPLRSRANTDAFREGWERVFGNKAQGEEAVNITMKRGQAARSE